VPADCIPAADSGAAPDNSFEFDLQAILDGLLAQLNSATSGG